MLFSNTCGLQPALSYRLLSRVQETRAGDTGIRVAGTVRAKAKGLNVKIEEIEIMPDYVHLSVLASPAITPQLIVNQLKGYTSHVLRERHDWLRSRLPTLWTRSYYIGRAGVVSQETIMEYIENQKNV